MVGRARKSPASSTPPARSATSSEVIDDIHGATLSPRVLSRLAKIDPEDLPAARGKPRLGACVGKVGNFLAVGLNYADHAAEMGMPIPQEPILFNKAPSCIVGPTTTS